MIKQHDRGFTLVEITAVVVLLALLAGAVSVSFFGWHSRAQMSSVIGRIKHFDRISRQYARSTDRPAKMVIRAIDNQLIYTEGLGEDIGIFDQQTHSPNLRVVNLPDGYHIERIIVDDHEGDFGEQVIHVSSKGQTPTYSLQILSDDNESHWLVFAGMTGQIIETDDDYQVQDIFALLTPRPDLN